MFDLNFIGNRVFKRVNIRLAAMLLLACTIIPSAFADTEVVDGIKWTYSLNNGKARVENDLFDTGICVCAISRSTTGAIAIPSTLGGCPVTSIGFCAFLGCSGLKSVNIPSSVTSIGHNAFSGCSGLKSVTLPSSGTSIGTDAFGGCRGLKIEH